MNAFKAVPFFGSKSFVKTITDFRIFSEKSLWPESGMRITHRNDYKILYGRSNCVVYTQTSLYLNLLSFIFIEIFYVFDLSDVSAASSCIHFLKLNGLKSEKCVLNVKNVLRYH